MTRKAKDLEADYASAGFDGALTPGNHPALILVDFARAYFDPNCGLYAGVEHVRTVAAGLAVAARAASIPVVFTRVEYSDAADGGIFYRKLPALSAFDRGNPFGDFTPELTPQDSDIVITKQFPSAFFGTDLADSLRSLDVDTLLITGLSTSGCVRATALDALCHGFIPLVIEDACGDRDQRVHDANIFDLRAKYAEIVNSAWARNYLAALASN
jgi:maleamate amidohydrolase